MEGNNVAKVELSIRGKTCVCQLPSGVLYATVTNSLFTVSSTDVKTTGWSCDLESLAGTDSALLLGDVDGSVWEWRDNSKTKLFDLESPVSDLDAVGGIVAAASDAPHPVTYSDGHTTKLEALHKGAIMSVGLSPSGAYLFSIGYEGRLFVYDLKSGSRLARCQISKKMHEDSQEKLRAAWAPDSLSLLVPGEKQLRKLPTSDWVLVDLTLAAEAMIVALRWTERKEVVAGFSADKRVFLWDVENQTKLAEYNSEETVSDLIVTATDVVFATFDGVINYWKREGAATTAKPPVVQQTAGAEKEESEEPESESEAINYFDLCIGALPQKPIAVPSYEVDGTIIHRSILGTVTATERNSVPVIEVELILEKSKRQVKFQNSHEFTIADMTETAVVLAGKGHFLLLKSLQRDNSQWMMDLPEAETIESVAIGETWACCYSSALLLRVFSIDGGVQLCALSMQSPVVALAAYADSLGIVSIEGAPVLGVQRLRLDTKDLGKLLKQEAVDSTSVDLAISPGEELVWFGFSMGGVPCTSDSAGVTRIYWKRAGLWVPVLRSPDFTVIGVGDGEVYGLEDGEIAAKSFTAQFCSTPYSANESSLFINKLLFDINSGTIEDEIEMEKQLINMLREAAVKDDEERVWAYFGLMRRKQTKSVSLKLLTEMKQFQLAQRLADRLSADSKPAIPPATGNDEGKQKAETPVKQPLVEKPQEVVAVDNPFGKKTQAKNDIFESLSGVAKRKAEPLPAPGKKRKV